MNKELLEYPGSLVMANKFIVSPYGLSQCAAYDRVKTLVASDINNRSRENFSIDYKDIGRLTVINGMGVTLGDSIIGISALHAIKEVNNAINLHIIRPEFCPEYVNEIYAYSKEIIDDISYMPYEINNLNRHELIIDTGNQLYWKDFNKKEMHDFFLENLGIEPSEVDVSIKSNLWLQSIDYPNLNLDKYVLFCANSSALIRSIPRQYHEIIVDKLSLKFNSDVYGFGEVTHPRYKNIQKLATNTKEFIAIIRNAYYVYTCDSSALHIASGFNIPTTCVFTTIKPELRSKYYNNCESVYLGSSATESIHSTDNEHIMNLVKQAFEEYYASY